MARAIMLQGTGSDVGKTLLIAGLCRVARNRGLKVRPFKPQNMSNNAAVALIPETGEWGEIGRAQWLQALACGVEPNVHMNPVLLKPQTDIGSQIIVRGKVAGAASARSFQKQKAELLQAVLDSFAILGEGADLILVEGAGSAAEVNLRGSDIANMGFATRAGVPVILVGDIDRGGVIASIAGTHLVLPPEDRAMICGFLINKFRGDESLFDKGIATITEFTGWKCFGIVPWMKDAHKLPAEDSVGLEKLSAQPSEGNIKIAVPVLSRISNFDDLDPLRGEPGVDLIFVQEGQRLPPDAAMVVLPGSKSTISDLEQMRANGWDTDLKSIRRRGGYVFGICGGYQMLGSRVKDPLGIEGRMIEAEGLGLLDVETTMEPVKIVQNRTARSLEFDLPLSGYEIHLGKTTGPDCSRPPVEIEGYPDGAMSPDKKVIGTYLHGIFGEDAFRTRILSKLGISNNKTNYRKDLETALDTISAHLERRIDCDLVFSSAR